ncbi:DVU0298 family protein [Desulfovibrio litoralis]|uniref:Uncharacterized protein n=1 Tax=Desulfovibrio litoralis DSM 11393 TaxID=1121455 RepID=A0A1M7S791_9BACT|nr:DVU0298 family protein [Desulfovibrio litoralis]SHN54224.1 hypothetical protein SAMN02745728_00509 [Desulfovibrio litoralis DSM 11393]
MASFRQLKTNWKTLILNGQQEEVLKQALALEGREAIAPLISFFCHDGTVKWYSINIFGAVVAQLAAKDIDTARIVMRQLMWQLNEESGNLGWGIPEAFASVLSNTASQSKHWELGKFSTKEKEQSAKLAHEYAKLLHSYILDTGSEDNFCEHAPLRQGAFWGNGRFCSAYPSLAKKCLASLIAGLKDEDYTCRLFALWALIQAKAVFDLNATENNEIHNALLLFKKENHTALESNSIHITLLDAPNWTQITEYNAQELLTTRLKV